MASAKNTFEPRTFLARTFAAGNWRGSYPPQTNGIQLCNVTGHIAKATATGSIGKISAVGSIGKATLFGQGDC